jgi:hypothetical protein
MVVDWIGQVFRSQLYFEVLLVGLFFQTNLQTLTRASTNYPQKTPTAGQRSCNSPRLVVGFSFGLNSYPHFVFARSDPDDFKLVSYRLSEEQCTPFFVAVQGLRENEAIINPNRGHCFCEMVLDFDL